MVRCPEPSAAWFGGGSIEEQLHRIDRKPSLPRLKEDIVDALIGEGLRRFDVKVVAVVGVTGPGARGGMNIDEAVAGEGLDSLRLCDVVKVAANQYRISRLAGVPHPFQQFACLRDPYGDTVALVVAVGQVGAVSV